MNCKTGLINPLRYIPVTFNFFSMNARRMSILRMFGNNNTFLYCLSIEFTALESLILQIKQKKCFDRYY